MAKQILREYRSYQRRQAVAGGAKKDFGTCDSRAPQQPRPRRDERGRKPRSIVEAPKSKLGPKLLLDER